MPRITEQRLSELNCSTITDREIRKLVKAYRKAKYENGWIEWGDRKPLTVSDTSPVEVILNDFRIITVFASTWRGWHSDPGFNGVIAYRVLTK